MDAPSSSSGPTSDGRAKRAAQRNSEARKEQNRVASRNYRQKRRQKLALLDSILQIDDIAPTSSDTGTSSRSHADYQSLSRPEDLTSSVTNLTSAHIPLASTSLIDSLTNHGWSNVVSGEAYPLVPAEDFALEEEPLRRLPFRDSGDFLGSGFEGTSLTVGGGTSLSRIAPRLHRRAEIEDVTEDPGDEDAVLSALGNCKNLSDQQKRQLIRRLQREIDPSASSSPQKPQLHPRAPGNWVSSHNRRSQARTRLQSEARRFATFVDQHIGGQLSPAQLSRIYSLEVGWFGAVFANCYALGMNDVESLMVDEGVSVFSLGPDTGHHPSQLPIIKKQFLQITPDLQPVDEQLTYGHHPYIDVIPFKVFRDNALKALQHEPPLFDEDDLCVDFSSGGMICWGSQHNSMGMEVGVPWDARSWEPQVWFLKKYWFLVGGWEDEMWKAARWWHGRRHQKVDIR